MRIVDRIGESIINNQGLKMTIIKYPNSKNITVKFEDGTIVEHRLYRDFKIGSIKNPNNRIGESIINNQGLKMTIIKYPNSKNITVKFEDGTIVEHRKYRDFKMGGINNPNYNIYNNRIGETNINSQGLKMTIIKYNSSLDITVQFEDGTIVEHKQYNSFKMGKINNPNYRIGESIINNQGLKMTIIEYITNMDITIQFEDGTIIEHRLYRDFKMGSINNPNYNIYNNRIGESIINSQGLKMTIIEQLNSHDITVKFEDGTIIEHRSYRDFKIGSIKNPNYNIYNNRIGESIINNQGLKMTIIKYPNSRDITIQFEDGTIVEHRSYKSFKMGGINNPNYNIYNNRTGETRVNNQGLKMTIIEYPNSHNITIQFEDGVIVEHKQYRDFKIGSIKNPNFSFPYQIPDSDIVIEKIAYVYKSQANYFYKCTKCGIYEIDTLENIVKHSKHKDLKMNKFKRILPYQIPDSDIVIEKIAYVRENDVNYLYKCNKCKLEDIDTLENINNHKCTILKEVI